MRAGSNASRMGGAARPTALKMGPLLCRFTARGRGHLLVIRQKMENSILCRIVVEVAHSAFASIVSSDIHHKAFSIRSKLAK